MRGNAQSFSAMTSSKSDLWATPQAWFDYLNLEFGFTLDACATADSAKCKKYFTPEDDGLTRSWADERVFMNPPYSDVATWMHKAYVEARDRGALVVCLVRASVDTRWWHDYAAKASDIRFPVGRVQYQSPGTTANAPFASAIVVFRPKL